MGAFLQLQPFVNISRVDGSRAREKRLIWRLCFGLRRIVRMEMTFRGNLNDIPVMHRHMCFK